MAQRRAKAKPKSKAAKKAPARKASKTKAASKRKATKKTPAKRKAPAKPRPPRRTKTPQLTPREKEVIRLVSLGCSVKEAAVILGLSSSTVDNHKYSAMHKLGTNKLALVTRLAIKKRITKLNDRLTPQEKEASGRGADGWN